METFYSNHLNCKVRQIQKRTARRLFYAGATIYLQSSNLLFDNVWQYPMDIARNGYSYSGMSFDSIVDGFEIYNCDNERGKYAHFYVKC